MWLWQLSCYFIPSFVFYCTSSWRYLIYAVGHYSFHLPRRRNLGDKNALKSTVPQLQPFWHLGLLNTLLNTLIYKNVLVCWTSLSYQDQKSAASQEVLNHSQPYLCWNQLPLLLHLQNIFRNIFNCSLWLLSFLGLSVAFEPINNLWFVFCNVLCNLSLVSPCCPFMHLS